MQAKGLFSVAKNALVPMDGRGREMFGPAGLHIGDRVIVKIHRARNPEFNALAHAVFERIGNAIGQPMEVVKLWIKWETGRVDLVRLPTGKHIPNPRSVAFESMDENEFRDFWNDAWPIIAEKILPGIPEHDFQEIRNIVDRREISA